MPPDGGVLLFEAERPRLLRLAYRMLGAHAEAEDVVQDAWLRWRGVEAGTVASPAAFLTRTVTRLCLDVMKSARVRRETYPGVWLPEPAVEPAEPAADADDLTLTLMLALERLSPLERAAFLLHDVFDVPLDEVAATLGREPPAVRQLASRARRHVREARPRYAVSAEEGAKLAQAFLAAAAQGDVAGLRGLLAETVVLRSDGGGKVIAFLNPIAGAERVARLYAGLRRKYGAQAAAIVRPVRIDGLPGFIIRAQDGILQTIAFEIEDGRIAAIYITRNPDKLTRVAAALAVN
ncbi:sigma-70 family RNA polymerase sigma factor [Zavarzinia compransoris]|uniref:RNA polymerase sigma factor SigJ n=1 Tax=Zavarzinia compransoris TaxID=1264899 RepID=A0A317E8X9_9PROT|nr:sigma-70 family RNA polymerase sigma factor [Zavarzinia compransoris]PWR21763.1 RNA polymerase sigma factor SigJ [Zavarzinia compransoris]TDP45439.1 RNA polymerase sigma-70 factor (ECF subfamily) [Zavarzinia compransoris]